MNGPRLRLSTVDEHGSYIAMSTRAKASRKRTGRDRSKLRKGTAGPSDLANLFRSPYEKYTLNDLLPEPMRPGSKETWPESGPRGSLVMRSHRSGLANVTVRDVDEEVVAWFRSQAKAHRRSLAGEIRALMEREARQRNKVAWLKRINLMRKRLPPRQPGMLTAVELVRQGRGEGLR
jgi:plasmid stability protein